MDTNAIFEKWRRDRSQVEPAADFADRVMQSVDSLPMPSGLPRGFPNGQQPAHGFLRTGVCAAAVLAALFRVAELFSLFAASSLDN